MNKTLIVFMRKPIEGRVKSRLAAGIGNSKALEVYRWLLEVTKQSFEHLSWPVELYFDTEAGPTPTFLSSYSHRIQSGIGLGSRMKSALQDHLNVGRKNSVVLIGSDCPEMDQKTIEMAFETLNEHDLVLGPALDGGVYLIGMKKDATSLFEHIDWGTDLVLKQLIDAAEEAGVNYSLLEEKSDIDNVHDYLKFEEAFQTHIKNTSHVFEG